MNRTKRERLPFYGGVLFLFVLFVGLAPLAAQETTGSIGGTVLDASGAAVPNAKIEISGGAVPRALTVTTDMAGNYSLGQVPPGNYNVSASAQGFSVTKKTAVLVVLGKNSRVDFKLEVGQLTQSVVISADAAMVDTASSASAVNVERVFFDVIPKGRSFYDLIGVAPGARNETKAGAYQIDGASGSENTYYIDGMEVTDIQTGVLGSRAKVPVEMIEQIQVKNGVMDAQYGGAMGGVVNAIVRSGTNSFHGQAGFYFDNDGMSARERPSLRLSPFDENQVEYFQNKMDSYSNWNPVFDIGGPILKDKLFFFAGFMPTTKTIDRQVDFNTGESGNYHRKERQHYTTAKVDFIPFTKLRTTMSWQWTPNYNQGVLPARGGTDAFDSPYAGEGDYQAGQTLAGQADYLATNKLIFSFRGGYKYTNYNNIYSLPTNVSVYYSGASTTLPPPELQGPNGWVSYAAGGVPYDIYERKNYNADVSYLLNWHGQHNLKGGWQMNQLSNYVNRSSYANGYFRYYWGLNYRCITSQCSGQQTGPYGYYRYRVLGTTGDASSDNQGIFFQDNWRVNKRLNINIGIRSEREFLPSFKKAGVEAAPPIEFTWSQKVSPRIGVAIDPKGDAKQRIYASFGDFYDVMKYEMPRGSFGGDTWLEWFQSFDDPNWVNTNNGAPADPSTLPGTHFETVNWRIPSNDPNAHLIEPNLKPVKQRMFDLGYEYSVNSNLVASVRYTNRRLIRTIEDTGYLGVDGETYLIANPGEGITTGAYWTNLWQGDTSIPSTPKPKRHYDAIEGRLDKRFSRNYQFVASYTWSRLWGNYSGLSSSDENGRNSPNVNRFYDMPWIGYTQNGTMAEGLLATDRPHTFKFFGGYSLKSVLGSTTLSPNIALYSGTPITTEALVVSSTPAFPFGRGDQGRTPWFHSFDFNVMHDFLPFKNHESMKLRFELSVFNLFNNSTVTDKSKEIIHPSDGQLQFDNYADFFKGFDTKALMQAQGIRTDPQYGLANSFQGPRTLRLQLAFFF